MYRIIKDSLVFLSMALLLIFTIWNLTVFSEPLPGAVVENVYVQTSQANILQDLKKIAEEKHVIIAKRIFIPEGTPRDGFVGKYRFQKIGKGKLPDIYPEEKNPKILATRNNETIYIIIGSGINAKQLAALLNDKGNVAFGDRVDNRIDAVKTLLTDYRLPILTLLITFASLLLAEEVAKIKSDGIRRLAGVSRSKLAFSAAFNFAGFMLLVFLFLSLAGCAYMLLVHKFWGAYVQSLILTLFLGMVTFVLIDFFISVLVFYALQSQPINISIKGKAPLAIITAVIVIFQSTAIMISMFSVSEVNHAKEQVTLLHKAQKGWKNNQHYVAPTLAGSVFKADRADLQKLFLGILSQKGSLLAYSTALSAVTTAKEWKMSQSHYMFESDADKNPFFNVLYANLEYLKKENIKLSNQTMNKLTHFQAGEYAILVPESQKVNFQKISVFQAGSEKSVMRSLSTHPITALYQNSQPIFSYTIMRNQTNNYSFLQAPVIIVFDEKTFENASPEEVASNALSFLSGGKLLIPKQAEAQVNNLFAANHLQKYEGAYFNGYITITDKLITQMNQRNFLYVVNLFCLIASILLILLLNSIYFFQNRRSFLIQRLSGKSQAEIHLIYFSMVIVLVSGISLISYLWLHIPAEAFIVPIIYFVLVFSLFAVQLQHERKMKIQYIKGM
ncbi:MAG: DUF1430 domain-containing protein [Streptococcaceae bacterium]|jgi:putative ABC transport system permease protein|nr:DUF1430 domain-containing protein [Streptococcaceae bacterium]